jgi:hypothetical protein
MAGKSAKVTSTKSQRRAAGAASSPAASSRVRKAPASAPSVAAQLPPIGRARTRAAVRKFEAGIIARKEAAPPGTPLPPGATHEIVGTRPDGTPILRRKRFSAA